MPELPEVETVAAQLRAALTRRTVRTVTIHRSDYVRVGGTEIAETLPGKRCLRVDRVGKRITLKLHPVGEMSLHLGMTGNVTLEASNAPVLPHTHATIRFEGLRREVRMRDPRRFGGIWYCPDGPIPEVPHMGRLGPDALTVETPEFKTLVNRRRQIKALLMDQRVISGLGNIYCDEALHAAGIHPLAPGADIESKQLSKLATQIRRTLARAVRLGGSSISDYRNANGEQGWFQLKHRVYGRAGEPCRTCRAPIESQQIAGRTTHFCPNCQQLK